MRSAQSYREQQEMRGRSEGSWYIRTFLAVAVLCWTILSSGTAQSAPVRVELQGLRAPERRNALATLGVALASSEHAVTEQRIHLLHARAPGEIALALQPFGYYRPLIESDLSYQRNRWVARYTVEPGSRVRVARVTIQLTGDGAREEQFRRAVAEFPLREGDPLSHLAYELGKTRLLNVASELGYLDAVFERKELRVDVESYTAEVELAFHTGPRFIFGAVSFDQEVVEPGLLRSFVRFERGDPFSILPLLDLQSALTDSPYFSRVEVVPRRDLAVGLEVPIQVQVVARRPQRYEFGLGYGTNTGPRGTFEVELRRLNRRGHRARGELAASPLERRVSGRYVIPFAYPRSEVLSLAAGFARITPATSSSDVAVVSATLARARGGWQETVGLTFQLEDFAVGADTGMSNLLMPSLSWSFTKADDRLYPSRGGRVRLELQGALRRWGSNASFGRVRLGGKLLRSLSQDTRVLGRVDLGGILTSQLRELPPTVRFFAGGDQSVRGYGFRSLGPLDEAGNVIGGRVLVAASIEIEQRLFGSWGVAGFYDVGNALRSLEGVLEQGVGGGIRWLSPVGLVRLDVAAAVSEAGAPLRIHITVGPDL